MQSEPLMYCYSRFGLFRFRSPLLAESRLISLPPGTQMFQFPRFPSYTYLIQYTIHDSSSWVFPHSEICGSMLICSSPQLIAACHVLHRLPMPRHSPYALLRLNYFCISGDILSVLVFSRLNCCVFHTCSLRLFIVFGKIVSFYPLRKNLISIRRFYSAVYDFQFPFTFVCHVCHIYSLKNQYVISLIRFSMSILFSLTLVKLVRHLIFHQVPQKFNEKLPRVCSLHTSGLKWTRTTDLALIRRAL